MKKLPITGLCVLSAVLLCIPSLAADNGGYEVIDLSQRETVNGKMLVIIAYAVIFGVLCLYTWSIARREQKVRKSAAALRRAVKSAEKK